MTLSPDRPAAAARVLSRSIPRLSGHPDTDTAHSSPPATIAIEWRHPDQRGNLPAVEEAQLMDLGE